MVSKRLKTRRENIGDSLSMQSNGMPPGTHTAWYLFGQSAASDEFPFKSEQFQLFL